MSLAVSRVWLRGLSKATRGFKPRSPRVEKLLDKEKKQMAKGDLLKAQIAKARAGGGSPKLTVHFAGENEEAFNLNDWTITVDSGLPQIDDAILILEKNDGSQVVVILFVNVTFYRFEP
jgi:hypothetical protein